MARQAFNKYAEYYYYCCGFIHISTLISIIIVLQLHYIAYISLLTLSSLDSFMEGIIKNICVTIFFVYGVIITNYVGNGYVCFWPSFLWAICWCTSSYVHFVFSLIVSFFWNKKFTSTIESDLRFYHLPETLMEPEAYYYLMAILNLKNLVVFILYVFMFLVIVRYKKYLNDLKRDPIFILDESEVDGLEVTDIIAYDQNFPECFQIKNGQFFQFRGRVYRAIC